LSKKINEFGILDWVNWIIFSWALLGLLAMIFVGSRSEVFLGSFRVDTNTIALILLIGYMGLNGIKFVLLGKKQVGIYLILFSVVSMVIYYLLNFAMLAS
jgi:hypothetical protein